jgi:hypothetical protein
MEIEQIQLHKELNEGIITYDGFDGCIIGVDVFSAKFIYSFEKMLKKLEDEGINEEDVIEYLMHNFNLGGEDIPIILDGLS